MKIAFNIKSIDDVQWSWATDVYRKLSDEEKVRVWNLLSSFWEYPPSIDEVRSFMKYQVPDLLRWDGYRVLSQSNLDSVITQYPEKYRKSLKDWAVWRMTPASQDVGDMNGAITTQGELDKKFHLMREYNCNSIEEAENRKDESVYESLRSAH